MAGIVKAACLECRRRRIKCDKIRPKCGQCKRSLRQCVNYTFVDENVNTLPSSSICQERTGKHMWYISHSRKEGGALFQRWHQSNTVSESIPRVCFGKTERKSNELISCFEDGPVGSRITVWGDWTKHLPQQLGISAALDDAVALVMATHSAIIHKKCYTTWVDPRLYAKALGSLRHALADPSVYSSVHTLAAITALYYLEGLQGSGMSRIMAGVKHAGGVVRFLEFRGPSEPKNSFDSEVQKQVRHTSFGYTLQTNTVGFQILPQWSYLYQDSQAGSQPPSPKEILLQALAWWPYFAHEMRALHLAKGASRVAMLDLVKKFTEVRGLLDEVGTVLQELLAAGTSIRYVDSRHSDPLFPIVLEYEDRTLAWVFMLHACYTLALDYMFIAAREYSPFTYACPFPESLFAATRGERVEELCMRIFQSCEYIQQFAPLGHGFIQPALYTAYHYAIDEELKAWVLKSLNDTESFQGQSESLYTDALAKWFFELETGEMPLRTMK